MHYTVKLTNYVVEQLQEIDRYIAWSLLSPDVASNWMQRLKAEFASLGFMPNRYPLTEEEPWHTAGIHRMSVKNYLVYYWVDERNQIVWITSVVYGRRDQILELRKMPKDVIS